MASSLYRRSPQLYEPEFFGYSWLPVILGSWLQGSLEQSRSLEISQAWEQGPNSESRAQVTSKLRQNRMCTEELLRALLEISELQRAILDLGGCRYTCSYWRVASNVTDDNFEHMQGLVSKSRVHTLLLLS